jgi:hypothetical protein
MGKPELAEEARFRGHTDRVTSAEELRQIVQQWLDSMPNDEQIYRPLASWFADYAEKMGSTRAFRIDPAEVT